MTDHLGEHHPLAQAGDLNYCRSEAGITYEPRTHAPAVLAADLGRVTVVVPRSPGH